MQLTFKPYIHEFVIVLQIPDTKSGEKRIDAVVVDEDAVGSMDRPGCGAKILYGDGAFDRYISQIKVRIANLNQCAFIFCLVMLVNVYVEFYHLLPVIFCGLKMLQAMGDGAGSEVDGDPDISSSRAMSM